MRIAMRATLRLALTGWLGLALLAAQGRAATPPEKVLPDSTLLFVKVNNAAALRESFRQSQFGQLWKDPALKDFKESFAERLDESGKGLKEKLGITFQELYELPQGTVAMALVGREDPKVPAALVLTLDVGKNLATTTDILTKATKQAEDKGAEVETQEFKGQKLHVIHPPKKKEDKEDGKPQPPLEKKEDKEDGKPQPPLEKKEDKEDGKPQPPLVWTNLGPRFTIASDVDVLKDVIANSDGRDNSLASYEPFVQAQKKLGPGAQVIWYVDVVRFLKLNVLTSAGAATRGNPAQAKQQAEAMFQVTGINGLKALAGNFDLNTGNYDSLSKTIVLAPSPVQGVLKIFQMPKVNLKPELWVPASVFNYRTISWNLDAAYTALNDLVNMFQPGVLNVLEQQLVGPNGGDPLSFQKDVIGPLGNRITLISDFKKPIKEDSQRSLLGIAVDDPKTFQGTLNRLITLSGRQPKKREFQGTTIYDFEIPDLPNANANANNVRFKGPLSVAIAKHTLFVSNEPRLLEQVLRGGAATLADSPEFKAVRNEIPDQVSGMSFTRPDESARVSYDLIKSGQFENALHSAAGAGAPDISKLTRLIDKDKLPDFSVFTKYLSQGGGYSVMDDDGVTFTAFTLRKEKP